MNQRARQKLVSVIIPAFNAGAYLAETINSVLQQTWGPLETIVVVDDRSTDNSAELAMGFGASVRMLTAAQPGLAFARNLGMDEAQGDFILHLDADDLLLAESIEKLMECFDLDQRCQIASGRVLSFLSPELVGESAQRYVIPVEPQRGHLPGVSIVRSEAFKVFGKFDETYAVNSDLDWWIRALDDGALVCSIDDVVLRRRIHGNNLSIIHSELLNATRLKIVSTTLRRRRRAAESLEH